MLGLSAFFMLFQLGLACVLIYARGCEKQKIRQESNSALAYKPTEIS